MNTPPFALALLATLCLAAAVLLHPGNLAPTWAPIGLVTVGMLPAVWGAARGAARVHAIGALTQLTGVGLTGPFAPPSIVLVGTLGVVLAIGAWTLGQTVPGGSGGGTLTAVAGGTAVVVAVGGWGTAEGLSLLAGGGADAVAAIPGWIVLATAGTWMLLRWSRGGQ